MEAPPGPPSFVKLSLVVQRTMERAYGALAAVIASYVHPEYHIAFVHRLQREISLNNAHILQVCQQVGQGAETASIRVVCSYASFGDPFTCRAQMGAHCARHKPHEGTVYR